jgi:arylsulfatase A-like enzyme
MSGEQSLRASALALLVCAAGLAACDGGGATGSVERIVLVSIDTLRADHVGCYGAKDAKTPVIDALAREGVVFEDATAQSNTTGPSHTTMLTGTYPAEHGALANGRPLSHRAKTLADALQKTHATAAFVSGFTLVDSACGLAERFDRYDDDMLAWRWLPTACDRLRLISSAIRFAERRGHEVRRADRPAQETVELALDWLGERRGQPFFCWVHLYDPHAPYEPPEEFARLHGIDDEREPSWYGIDTRGREGLISDPAAVARMNRQYAAEISYADQQVGRVLDALRADGSLDRTLVVLTSDHGEGLGSHGYWFDHGAFLFDEELHVPLVMRLPRAEHSGLRVKNQVRLLDLAPTVLDVLGQPSAMKTSGASLMPLVTGAGDSIERPSFALSWMDGSVSGFDMDGQRQSLRLHGHKAIWTSSHWLDTLRNPERLELYDLTKDRDEQHDLASNAAIAFQSELIPRLMKWRNATVISRDEGELDEHVLEQLRKLGY